MNTLSRSSSRHKPFQKDWRSCHEADPVPVPNCRPKYPGTVRSLHADPHFSEASILVDALREEGPSTHAASDLNQIWRNCTHHYLDVLYFTDAGVHRVIHRQAQVNQKVFVRHTSQFHERYGVAVIKAAFIFIRLQMYRLLSVNTQHLVSSYLHVLAAVTQVYLSDCKCASERSLLHWVKLCGPLGF